MSSHFFNIMTEQCNVSEFFREGISYFRNEDGESLNKLPKKRNESWGMDEKINSKAAEIDSFY